MHREEELFFSPTIISLEMCDVSTRISVVRVHIYINFSTNKFSESFERMQDTYEILLWETAMYISSVFYFHDIAANVRRVCIFIRECKFSVYVLPARYNRNERRAYRKDGIGIHGELYRVAIN